MTARVLPAYRLAARPCAAPGCSNVLSQGDTDGYCCQCHADPTLFNADGSLRQMATRPCARCGVNPRLPSDCYCRPCRNTISLESVRRNNRRRKAGQMEMGL